MTPRARQAIAITLALGLLGALFWCFLGSPKPAPPGDDDSSAVDDDDSSDDDDSGGESSVE